MGSGTSNNPYVYSYYLHPRQGVVRMNTQSPYIYTYNIPVSEKIIVLQQDHLEPRKEIYLPPMKEYGYTAHSQFYNSNSNINQTQIIYSKMNQGTSKKMYEGSLEIKNSESRRISGKRSEYEPTTPMPRPC